jgi:hypothetical protein
MISNLIDLKYDLLSLAATYGDYLVKHPHSHLSGKENDPSGASLQWRNPENIESGASGNLLFLLELYRQTEDEKYLKSADQSIQELLVYCEKHPTYNYSLYTGRGGFIYVLLQRYLLRADAQLLEAMLHLVKPVNNEYLHSTYTSDYLYDGRAGTLLLLQHLYAVTKEDFLAGYIEQFVQKIVGNARFSEAGASWYPSDEMNLKAACGFARGTAGISYALCQLNRTEHQSSLQFLLHETKRYIASCWLEEYQNWGDFTKDIRSNGALKSCREAYVLGTADLFVPGDAISWADGAAGILFPQPGCTGHKRTAAVSEKLTALLATEEIQSGGLYDGLAGLGMYYLQSGREQEPELETIVNVLQSRLSELPLEAALEGGFMRNGLGSMYFLLKTNKSEAAFENILFPFSISQAAQVQLKLPFAEIRKTILSAAYPRTVFILEKITGDIFTTYLERLPANDASKELEEFASFMEIEMRASMAAPMYERMEDLFNLEKAKRAFHQKETRPRLQTYLEQMEFRDSIMELLNRPDSWLVQQPIGLSANINIAFTRWDWSYLDDFEPLRNKDVKERLVKNFAVAPREYEYIFRIDARQEIEELRCDMVLQLVVHRFNQVKSITAASLEMKHYVQSLTEKALESLLIAVGAGKSSTPKEFVAQLDTMLLDNIKTLLHRNILAFEKTNQ